MLDRITIRKKWGKQTVNHWEEMVHKVVLLVRGDAVICRIVPENVENPKKESFIEPIEFWDLDNDKTNKT